MTRVNNLLTELLSSFFTACTIAAEAEIARLDAQAAEIEWSGPRPAELASLVA